MTDDQPPGGHRFACGNTVASEAKLIEHDVGVCVDAWHVGCSGTRHEFERHLTGRNERGERRLEQVAALLRRVT